MPVLLTSAGIHSTPGILTMPTRPVPTRVGRMRYRMTDPLQRMNGNAAKCLPTVGQRRNVRMGDT